MSPVATSLVPLAAITLLALRPPVSGQHPVDFDPVGEYAVEASLEGAPLDAVLTILSDDDVLSARFAVPDQPTLTLGTVRVDGRTVRLADQVAAADLSFELTFETDSTFKGTWAVGPDRGTLEGRTDGVPDLSPEAPPCPDGSGDLPPPSPVPAPASDPEAARIMASDVSLFWKVVDEAPPGSLAERLHCDYLREGTDALRDFIPARIVSGEHLAEAVKTRRDRYEAARRSSKSMAELEQEIRDVFHELRERYPDAVFPDVYFVMGRLNTGGMISQRGLLIGAEMYTDPSEILPLVAHELVHYQQRPIPVDETTLLAQSIMEGSADFIAELLSGDHVTPAAHEYGLARESELWEEFTRVMHGDDLSGWLYGGAPEGRPEDLGYFFGYRIAEAYYTRAGSDRRALHDLLNITDYADFLERSGYDP